MTIFNLDDFIKSNDKKIFVHGSSAPCRISNVTFLPGSEVDLSVLAGQEYKLEELNGVRDLSQRIGYAHILTPDGSNTGYHLVSFGSESESHYYLEDDGIYQRFEKHLNQRGSLFGKFVWHPKI